MRFADSYESSSFESKGITFGIMFVCYVSQHYDLKTCWDCMIILGL